MNPTVFMASAALLAVIATPAAAQTPTPAAASEPPVTAPAAPVSPSAAPASTPGTTQTGPRIRADDFRRVEPALTTSPDPVVRHRKAETITVSTLVLVLLVVILVLLVT